MYQGFANHATFTVGWWIDNDEKVLHTVRALTLQSWHKSRKDQDRSMSARFDLAAELLEFVENQTPELPMPFGDLLNSALEEVAWNELADGYLSEFIPEYLAKMPA